jgi:hypothetical protein
VYNLIIVYYYVMGSSLSHCAGGFCITISLLHEPLHISQVTLLSVTAGRIFFEFPNFDGSLESSRMTGGRGEGGGSFDRFQKTRKLDSMDSFHNGLGLPALCQGYEFAAQSHAGKCKVGSLALAPVIAYGLGPGRT